MEPEDAIGQQASSPLFAAYVYPGWHSSAYRPSFNEWSMLDNFKPYFEGHRPPSRPLGGSYDDSEPSTVKRQMALAMSAGIGAFSYFTYYQPGGFVLAEPVDAAVRVAERSIDFKISLTWCIRLPHNRLPVSARGPTSGADARSGAAVVPHGTANGQAPVRLPPEEVPLDRLTLSDLELLFGPRILDDVNVLPLSNSLTKKGTAQLLRERTPQLSWKDVESLFSTWALSYCNHALYWRVGGRPVCSVLNLTDFVERYGLAMFKFILLQGKGILERLLGERPFMVGVIGQIDPPGAYIANQLPLDAVTGYGLLPNWLGEPVQHYEALIKQRVEEWYAFQARLDVPFFPVASAGWDATVRGERLAAIRAEAGYPWSPVVIGVTPELFGQSLDEALKFNRETHSQHNIVFIHAWNEWTEGAAVEPSDRYGRAFLDEISSRAGKAQLRRSGLYAC